MATTTLDKFEERYSREHLEEYVKRTKETSLEEGAAALKRKDYEKALHIFERLSQEKGRSFQIELGKVLAFNELGRWEQSIKTLTGMLGMGDDKKVLVGIGWAKAQLEQHDEALDTFNQLIASWPDVAEVWVFRYPSLVSLDRMQEARESLEGAYLHRHKYSPSVIWSLYYAGAVVLLLLGVTSIEKRSLRNLEAITKGFIMWREQARLDNQAAAFRDGAAAAAKEMLTNEKTEVYEEFILSVRLGSIEDPFEGWKALGEEISKVWPKGVSAVDAIREQRE